MVILRMKSLGLGDVEALAGDPRVGCDCRLQWLQTPASDHNRIARCVKRLRQAASDPGAAACDQYGIAADLHVALAALSSHSIVRLFSSPIFFEKSM